MGIGLKRGRTGPTSPAANVVRGLSSRPAASTSRMRAPTTATPGSAARAASSRARRSGAEWSSASWIATIGAAAACSPALSERAIPRLRPSRITLPRGSEPIASAATAADRSLEPSSITISSSRRSLCPRIEEIARATVLSLS